MQHLKEAIWMYLPYDEKWSTVLYRLPFLKSSSYMLGTCMNQVNTVGGSSSDVEIVLQDPLCQALFIDTSFSLVIKKEQFEVQLCNEFICTSVLEFLISKKEFFLNNEFFLSRSVFWTSLAQVGAHQWNLIW